MTDEEVIAFCNIGNEPPEFVARFLAALTPERRALYDKMRQVEMWDASNGLIPLPEGVIICKEHRRAKAQGEKT